MKKILFVCLGNICRSPVAEAVMNEFIRCNGKDQEINCDSAGILDYHAGEPADQRMQSHAGKRGYHLTSISRQIDPEKDFDRFDMIIGMDRQNIKALMSLAHTEKDKEKIHLMTDFLKERKYHHVPDPYFGGDEGFELVLDIVEEACEELIRHISNGEKSL